MAAKKLADGVYVEMVVVTSGVEKKIRVDVKTLLGDAWEDRVTAMTLATSE